MNTKSSVYPAVIVACLLGLVGLLLVWLRFNVSIEITGPETSSLPETVERGSQSRSGEPDSTIPSVPTPVRKLTEPVKHNTSSVSSPGPGVAGGQGALRMSNQTDQPVRVALLAVQSVATGAARQPTYGNPAHWDFAPKEGSAKGLLLSLPEGNFKLKKGDILVVFAQDGSRRYWGPYVVGETASPVWNRQAAEWQLTLQP